MVILDKKDYINGVEDHIKNGPYQEYRTSRKHPVEKFQKQVTDKLIDLERRGLITRSERMKMTVSNPRIPRMSGLPKTHKPGNQIRPVVTNIDAPANRVADFLVKKLKNLKNEETFSVKNSIELVKLLEKETISEEEELVSFDVKALFPSIPVDEAVELIKARLVDSDISDQECELCGELLDLVVSQKIFQFNHKFFMIVAGTSIGCRLSPYLAEAFMVHFENKIMEKSWAPRFYRRYVDDIIAIVPKGTGENVLKELNEMHENLEFTLEKEKDGKLPFLDLIIKRNGEKFSYEIYRKPTDAPLCTPFESHTPMAYKTATFESMFHRLFNIPLSHDDFQKELKYIYEVGERRKST